VVLGDELGEGVLGAGLELGDEDGLFVRNGYRTRQMTH
jgi:hypothetical protein